MNTTGWLKGLQVTADGTGIVSHVGVALLRGLSDNIGLTAGLSKALASRRLLVHDRGRVPAGYRWLDVTGDGRGSPPEGDRVTFRGPAPSFRPRAAGT